MLIPTIILVDRAILSSCPLRGNGMQELGTWGVFGIFEAQWNPMNTYGDK